MKTLCITGSVPAHLACVAATLQEAGLKPPQPTAGSATGTDIPDLSAWHQRFLATQGDWPPAPASLAQPGRLWERLAADLFLANIDQPLWGWADSNSLWLLDFWHGFEPQLRFLLLAAPAEDLLAAACTDPRLPTDPDTLLRAWTLGQQHLLRFHLRHPQHSLLLDARAALRNPAWLIERCRAHWDWPLGTRPSLSPCDQAPADPLTAALAASLGADTPATRSLLNEIAAAWHSDSATIALAAPPQAAVIQAYRRLQDEADRHRQDNERLHRELSDLRDRQVAEATKRQRDTEAQLKDMTEENELLLLQLHQVQEELEDYFLKHQAAEQQRQDSEARWQRLLQRHPDLYDYLDLTAELTSDSAAIRWQIQDLHAAGQHFARIDCLTRLERGRMQVLFDPDRASSAEDADTRCWPSTDPHLSDWSARDWHRLRLLPRVLADALADPHAIGLPERFTAEPWQRALHDLPEALHPAVAVLRWDYISLEHEQVNPDYEHLSLSLTPLVFAQHHWPRWELRLSCANLGPDRFGTHPKLEFPAMTAHNPLTGWFAEVHNDFGASLELRFALPDAMDMNIWQRLPAPDQALITALIARLPALLDQLERSGVQIARPWRDWQRLAADIQRIHAPYGMRP